MKEMARLEKEFICIYLLFVFFVEKTSVGNGRETGDGRETQTSRGRRISVFLMIGRSFERKLNRRIISIGVRFMN